MNAIVTNLAGKHAKKVISENTKRYTPDDPLYIFWVDDNGKQKRTNRPPPPGLTKKQAKLLRKIQRRAHYLDKGIQLCGFRVGWTFFIGLIPGAGDVVDAALNYLLVFRPAKNGTELPAWVVREMLFNNAVSAGVGFIPLLGDIALATWKANWRNAKLLEEVLRVQGEENLANGVQGLTPYTDERGRKIDHPAQQSARELARSERNVLAGNSNVRPAGMNSNTAAQRQAPSGTATPATTATAATSTAADGTTERKKSFFSKKK